MDIGKKYFDFATCAKELGDLDLLSIVSMKNVNNFLRRAYHGNKVGAMRSVRSGSETLEGHPVQPTVL